MKDQIQPSGKWNFNADVADAFDDMLARCIPQYEVMRRACFDIGRNYVHPGCTILDIGCSRGEALSSFAEKYAQDNPIVGLEISDPMLEAARKRFSSLRTIQINKHDLRAKLYPYSNVCVTLSILTLQFTPIEYRLQILHNIWKSLNPNGALILVEKVLGTHADLDALFVQKYYDMKAENGYTEDQIQRKRLSLEGVLVPVTPAWNEDLLRSSGFTQVDCFWRWMNFAGWIAVK